MLSALFARGPLGLGELLDASFRLLRMRFGAFVVIAGIFAVITTGLEYIGAQTGTDSILNLLGGLLSIWQTAAVLCFIFALVGGAGLSIGASLSAGLRKFWRMFGVSFLQGLAIGLSVLPGAFVLGAGAFAGPVAIVVGFAIMLIPAVYLGARWCVAAQVLIAEQCSSSEALGRSWNLTRGHIWRCIGYYVLVGALSLLFLWLPLVLTGGLLGMVPFQWGGPVEALIYALALLLSAIWVPFSLIAFTLLYYDLRVRNEGLDLELQVAQIEEEAAQAQVESPPVSPTQTDI